MSSRYKDLLSWLSPHGIFHPVKGVTHNDDAPLLANIPDRVQAREKLLTSGWMRVAFLNANLFANNPHKMPNNLQLSELIELALTRKNVKHISYDNDKNSKILWSLDEQI